MGDDHYGPSAIGDGNNNKYNNKDLKEEGGIEANGPYPFNEGTSEGIWDLSAMGNNCQVFLEMQTEHRTILLRRVLHLLHVLPIDVMLLLDTDRCGEVHQRRCQGCQEVNKQVLWGGGQKQEHQGDGGAPVGVSQILEANELGLG